MALKFLAGLAAVATGTHAGGAAGRRLLVRAAELSHRYARPNADGWVRADRFLVSGSAFVTILLFARYLDLETFGAFMLAYTALLLFVALQKALVAEPHRVLGAALSEPERRRHTGSAAVMDALGILALCAVLCAAGGITAALYSPAAGDVLVALAVTAVPWLAQDFLRRALHARGRSRDAAVNSAVTQALQIFGVVVLCAMAAPWATPVSALSVLALSAMVGAIVGMWQLQPLVDFGRAAKGQYGRAWADAWRHGKALTAQNGLVWLGGQGPSWIVALLLGVEQLGLYRALAHLAHAADPFLQAGRGSARAMTVLLFSLAPFAAALALFPEPVLELVYADRFSAAGLAPVLVLAAAAQAMGYARIPLEAGFAEVRARHPALVPLVPAVTAVILAAVLVQILGVAGAPLAVLCANLVLLTAAWVAHRRRVSPTGL